MNNINFSFNQPIICTTVEPSTHKTASTNNKLTKSTRSNQQKKLTINWRQCVSHYHINLSDLTSSNNNKICCHFWHKSLTTTSIVQVEQELCRCHTILQHFIYME